MDSLAGAREAAGIDDRNETPQRPSPRLIEAFAFSVLGGSILASVLWFHLLKVCGASAASAYHFLMPPLGMFFAWMVLGEHVEARDLLGVFSVALGIYLVTRPSATTVQPSLVRLSSQRSQS